MTCKKMKPARGNGTGLELDLLRSASNREVTLFSSPNQDAIGWLARRARISLATANAVAAANHWGCA